MSNTLTSNPADMITLDRDDTVWHFPNTENPVEQVIEERKQRQYVDALAQDEQVSPLETVPAAGDVAVYTDNANTAIDPMNSEAVVAAAGAAVNEVFANDPELIAQHQANEAQRMSREHHAATLELADALADRVTAIRDRFLIEEGVESER